MGKKFENILICGGRNYKDLETMRLIIFPLSPRKIIHGGATGADYLATQVAHEIGATCQVYEANWKLGRQAGPARNQRMLDKGCPDLVVAFPGGKGTADMVRRAKSNGYMVVEVSKRPQ